jgi:hypothetical protein
MTDGDMAGKIGEGFFVEDLGHQAHIGIELEPFSFAGCDAAALLTSVLKSEQEKKSKPGYIFVVSIYPGNRARFVQTSLPLRSLGELGTPVL